MLLRPSDRYRRGAQSRSKDDPYEQPSVPTGQGPSSLGAAFDAAAAVANAAALAGPQGHTCDLCKVPLLVCSCSRLAQALLPHASLEGFALHSRGAGSLLPCWESSRQ